MPRVPRSAIRISDGLAPASSLRLRGFGARVAPATFNLLNQWALGIADSYALAVLAEQTGMGLPIVVLPAVSAPLASRPQFARSLKALRGEGVSVLLGPGGTAPPGGGEDAFPWHLALEEAFSMTGFGS